jgi:hypothetical protein
VLGALAAAATAAVSFQADLGGPSKPFRHTVERCFGSGHAVLGLRQDWQNHLRTVKADIGPEFVRFHGLLVSVCPGQQHGEEENSHSLPIGTAHAPPRTHTHTPCPLPSLFFTRGGPAFRVYTSAAPRRGSLCVLG